MVSPLLTEPLWTHIFLQVAITRMKFDKGPHDYSLVADLAKHIPTEFVHALVEFCHVTFRTRQVPDAWHTTLFTTLPKSKAERMPADFNPLPWSGFAYLFLGPLEDWLEANQPQEQHGFKTKGRIEEHVFTTQTLHLNMPLWIASLGLSRAFDRPRWEALRRQN